MSGSNYKVGMIVTHKHAPDWGIGIIREIDESTLIINFQDVGVRYLESSIAPLKIIKANKSTIYNSPSKADVNYFAKPDKIYSLKDLEKTPPPSRRPGVYGWYFDEPPPYVPKNGCTPVKTGLWPFRTKWWLLYIGQADKLKDRIMKYHIGGGHYAEGTMSSFRLSLGCLLSNEYSLRLFYPSESFGKKEKKLNKWLEKHARIAWIETEYIDVVEPKAIEKYILPLNYEHNDHRLVQPLSDLRKAFRKIAKNSDRKPKKKYFKKAYKEFVKQCKSLGIKK